MEPSRTPRTMPRPSERRTRRNLVIAAGVAVGSTGVALLVGFEDPLFTASMTTAYVGLALLALTLLPGPLNVLRGRPNPVSTHLRRDLGIWAAVVALIHVGVGLQRHMKGQWHLYFLFPNRGGDLFGLRYDVFGTANWLGLAATGLIVVLLAISNDALLRRLGTPRWKWIQRWNYAVFPLVLLHGFVYQIPIGKRAWGWVAATVAVMVAVAGVQAMAVRRFRSRARGGAPRR